MKEPWLLIDCPYMAWRAHYTTGALSHNGTPTGVLYGFFRSLIAIQDFLSVSRVAFCFDGFGSKRRDLFPDYKSKRHGQKDQAASILSDEVHTQIRRLKHHYLPKLGFKNVFWEDGYEADDMIAALVQQHTDKEFIIVSGDEDFYQLLRPDVWIWHPRTKEAMTCQKFQELYQITPDRWKWVKAIGGCVTDEVPGVPGVREKTAIKCLLGTASPNATRKIRSMEVDMLAKNLPLVEIPFPGLGPMELRPDKVTVKRWRSFCTYFGMTNLIKLNLKGLLPYGIQAK